MEAPLSSPGRWIVDGRGEGRAVRVSAHAEGAFLIISTWKADACVGTVRLLPREAAELAGHVAWALAELATGLTDDARPAAPTTVRGWRRPLDRLRRLRSRSWVAR